MSSQPMADSSWSAFILSAGFRPFFLLTAFHAVGSVLLWMIWLAAQSGGSALDAVTLAAPPFLWHAHEMVFGFLTAAVAGFLLTAVPNWTGTSPVQGRALGLLIGLWLAGRVAFWTSAWWPNWVVAATDLLFLPVLTWMIAGALRQAGSKRNLPFLSLLALLSLANAADHASLLGLIGAGPWGRVVATDCVVVMMVIVGGRIAPAFSRNWLAARQQPSNVLAPRSLDRMAIVTAAAVLLADLAVLGLAVGDVPLELTVLRGVLQATAAVAAGVRLISWKPWRVAAEPLLWVLHLGMAWVVLGFWFRAVALCGPLAGFHDLSESAALHGHLAGAAGTLILGVMGRASLGHSGRPLTANSVMTVSYGAVGCAAALRVLGPMSWPEYYVPVMVAAAFLWVLAYGLFLTTFIPILAKPNDFLLKET